MANGKFKDLASGPEREIRQPEVGRNVEWLVFLPGLIQWLYILGSSLLLNDCLTFYIYTLRFTTHKSRAGLDLVSGI